MKRLPCDRGTSMIEFAIIAPVLIFLMIGAIEIGRYTYFAIVATHAARAGAQFAAQNLQTAVDASVSGPRTKSAAVGDGQSLSQWTVSSTIICTVSGVVTTCPASNTSTISPNLVYYVDVQVSGTFNSLLKYPGIPQTVPVTATAILPVSSQ